MIYFMLFSCLFIVLVVVLFCKPNLLIVSILSYPAFVILWSIVFPGMNYRLEQGMFPIINLGYIRLRVDELLMFCLFGSWITHVVFINLYRELKKITISIRLFLALGIIFTGVLFSLRLGIINHNPNIGTDLRILFPLIIGLPMAIWAFSRIEQYQLIWIIKLTIYALILSNIILLLSYFPFLNDIQYFTLWHEHVSQEAFTITLYLILFSIIISDRSSPVTLIGLFLPLSLIIFRIPKWWIFGIFVCTVFVLFKVSFITKKFNLSLLKFRKTLSLGIIIGITSFLVILLFPKTLTNSIVTFKERVLREDIRGDISGGRFLMWDLIIGNISDHPISGNGIGYRLSGIFPAEMESEGIFVEDHSIVLWFLVRFGIPFTLLLISFCLWFLRVGGQTYKIEKCSFKKILILVCVGNFIVILSMSLVGQLLFLFEFNVIFCWSIAAVWAIYSQNRMRIMLDKNSANQKNSTKACTGQIPLDE